MADSESDVKPLKEGYKYHVFISHSHKDMEEKDKIIAILEKRGYKCCDPDVAFSPADTVVDNIIECLKISQKVVAIVSKDFLESTYVVS